MGQGGGEGGWQMELRAFGYFVGRRVLVCSLLGAKGRLRMLDKHMCLHQFTSHFSKLRRSVG